MKFCYSILFLLCVYQDLSAAAKSIYCSQKLFRSEESTTSASGLSLEETLRNRENYEKIIKKNIAEQCAQEVAKRQNKKYIQQVDTFINNGTRHIDALDEAQKTTVTWFPFSIVNNHVLNGLPLSCNQSALCYEIIKARQQYSYIEPLSYEGTGGVVLKIIEKKLLESQLDLAYDLAVERQTKIHQNRNAVALSINKAFADKNCLLDVDQKITGEQNRLADEYLGLQALYNDSCKDVASARAYWSGRWNRLSGKLMQHNNFGQAALEQNRQEQARKAQEAERFAITEKKQQAQESFNMGLQDQQGHDLREQEKRLEQSEKDKADFRHACAYEQEQEQELIEKHAEKQRESALRKKQQEKEKKQAKKQKKLEDSRVIDQARQFNTLVGIVPHLPYDRFLKTKDFTSKGTVISGSLQQLLMLSSSFDSSDFLEQRCCAIESYANRLLNEHIELKKSGVGLGHYVARQPEIYTKFIALYHKLNQEVESFEYKDSSIETLQSTIDLDTIELCRVKDAYKQALDDKDQAKSVDLLQQLQSINKNIKSHKKMMDELPIIHAKKRVLKALDHLQWQGSMFNPALCLEQKAASCMPTLSTESNLDRTCITLFDNLTEIKRQPDASLFFLKKDDLWDIPKYKVELYQREAYAAIRSILSDPTITSMPHDVVSTDILDGCWNQIRPLALNKSIDMNTFIFEGQKKMESLAPKDIEYFKLIFVMHGKLLAVFKKILE